jgi:hypothetical protein
LCQLLTGQLWTPPRLQQMLQQRHAGLVQMQQALLQLQQALLHGQRKLSLHFQSGGYQL